jgi:tetratricopeptide (TPR) repeat protein
VDEYNPMGPNEWRWIYAAAVVCVVPMAIIGAMGMLPIKQAVALGVTIFLLGLIFHMVWRYKPLNEAAALLDEGRFAAAQYVLQGYLSKPLHRGGRARRRALFLHAQASWYLGETEQALEDVNTLLEKSDGPLLEVLCRNLEVACYVQMRKPLKVHETMRILLAVDGMTERQKWESRIHVAICAMNEELFHDAIEFLEAAEKACNDNTRKAYIFGMLAACYNRVKDYMRALGAVQDGRKLGPEDALTRSLLLDNFAFAKANLKQDLEEALTACEEGLALNVQAALPHLHTSRGEVYYAMRDFDNALKDLELAIAELPERDKNARQKAWFIKGKICPRPSASTAPRPSP